MKVSIASGAAIATAAIALVLAGASPAAAKQKNPAQKPAAAKMTCGGKNGCPSKVKDDKGADAQPPGDAKGADVKGVDVKGADAK